MSSVFLNQTRQVGFGDKVAASSTDRSALYKFCSVISVLILVFNFTIVVRRTARGKPKTAPPMMFRLVDPGIMKAFILLNINKNKFL